MTATSPAHWSHPAAVALLRTVDGVNIHASVRGQGTTAIVVAHGFSGGHRSGAFNRILGWLSDRFLVVAIDQRGHHHSGGECTLGHFEVHDIDVAVEYARKLGALKVFTLGFSMGAAGVIRHAALSRPEVARPEFDRALQVRHAPDGIITIGGAARWYYRGTLRMWMLHFLVGTRVGRIVVRNKYKVRANLSTWPAENHPRRQEIQPLDPRASVALLAPMPVLIIQGENDNYFLRDHGDSLYAAAQVPGHQAEYWFVPGMGHAEHATSKELIERIKSWIDVHESHTQ
ncbi:MAG: hypothetical protein RL410_903 [Actinomycetota bacterium]|jgi:pimeloyl-ACP methyl ester carboxylesterase